MFFNIFYRTIHWMGCQKETCTIPPIADYAERVLSYHKETGTIFSVQERFTRSRTACVQP
jgi:hypothetical protein